MRKRTCATAIVALVSKAHCLYGVTEKRGLAIWKLDKVFATFFPRFGSFAP